MKKETSLLRKEVGSLTGILLPFVIYYVCYLVASIALTFIVIVLLQNVFGLEQEFFTKNEASINGVISGMAMLVGVVALIPSLRQELLNEKHERIRINGKIPMTILLAISSSLAVNILFVLLHLTESSETYQEVAANQYGVAFGLGLVLYGIVSPFAEEVIFRGLIFNRMKRDYSVKAAILLSALMFGIYHGNSVQGLYGFLIGCLIAYIYERFGNLLYAILFHGAANIAVFTITGTESLYRVIVTPVGYVILTIISVGLIFLIEKMKRKETE